MTKLQALLYGGRKYHDDKGEMLPSSDETQKLLIIKLGFVKRYLIANDGALGIQIIYGPGDVFPLTMVFKTLFNQAIYTGPEVFYYEAMTPIEVYGIDAITLQKNAQANPEIYKDLLSEAGRHLEASVQRLENLTLANYYKRVAHQLVFFTRQFGEPTKNGIKITLPLTHQDIANVLSATRETVSISIARLRKKGLIKTGSYIFVTDLLKLEEEAFS